MGDGLLTALSMENHSSPSNHNELTLEMSPPGINRALSSPLPPPWAHTPPQLYDPDTYLALKKPGKKCSNRVDSIWGAWFFFSFYFKPVLIDKSKAKLVQDRNGISGFDKTDLQLEVFMVQHDMENMYMWVFKEMPENALGKMQLRSYMNGHSRQGERPFPFSSEKGFTRSHRMQRKRYRGLSNPQCVHGVEVVPAPVLTSLDEDQRRRWVELTGRDFGFAIPPEACDYGSWRNSANDSCDYSSHFHTKNVALMDPFPVGSKRKKGLVSGPKASTGGLTGPVTGGETTYEDEKGYLIMVGLPFVDLQMVKVSWRNTIMHGILKVWCTRTQSMAPFVKRRNRTFRLVDRDSEGCPSGEFVREIQRPTRIPENGEIEAYCDGKGTVLEILVPKLEAGREEHEVQVRVWPRQWGSEHVFN